MSTLVDGPVAGVMCLHSVLSIPGLAALLVHSDQADMPSPEETVQVNPAERPVVGVADKPWQLGSGLEVLVNDQVTLGDAWANSIDPKDHL
jgi:hypothetical protein